MKKRLLLIPLFMLLITGCGEEKKGSIACTLNSNDVVNNYKLESTYTINYTDDLVDSVSTVEIVKSDSKEILDLLETQLNNTYKAMSDNYGGYTYKITKESDKVKADVSIDYTKMDVNKLITDQPTLKGYVKNNRLLTKGLQSIYEQMGAECK